MLPIIIVFNYFCNASVVIRFGWSLLTSTPLIRPEADSFWHHDFQDALESCLHGLGKQLSF